MVSEIPTRIYVVKIMLRGCQDGIIIGNYARQKQQQAFQTVKWLSKTWLCDYFMPLLCYYYAIINRGLNYFFLWQ
jgi:hypothetical protein